MQLLQNVLVLELMGEVRKVKEEGFNRSKC